MITRIDRHGGFVLAPSSDKAPVAGAEERVGFGCRGGDLTEHAFEVAVALAGLARFGFRTGLDGLR